MRRFLVPSIAVVGLALACLPGCAKMHRLEVGMAGTEVSTIRIEMVGGECRVVDPEFQKIRSARGRAIKWEIAGTCTGVRKISVGRFTLDGASVDPISIRKTAEPRTNDTILAVVTDNPKPGVYRYEALFDGQPAKVMTAPGQKAMDDAGEFEVCPDWPCS